MTSFALNPGKYEKLASLLRQEVDENSIGDVFNVLLRLPKIGVDIRIKTPDGETLNVKKCEFRDSSPSFPFV